MPVRAVLFDLDDTLIDHSCATLAATKAAVALEPALSTASIEQVVAHSQMLLERLHPRVVCGQLTFDQARIERYSELWRAFGCNADKAEQLAAASASSATSQR